MMKDNSRLIEKYLTMVTESRAAMLDDPAGDLTAYDSAIDRMRAAAAAGGDDDLLRLSIEALIAQPDGRLFRFAGHSYRWPNDEFVPLLEHAYMRMWPDEERSPPGAEPEIEFVPMTPEEWAAYSGRG